MTPEILVGQNTIITLPTTDNPILAEYWQGEIVVDEAGSRKFRFIGMDVAKKNGLSNTALTKLVRDLNASATIVNPCRQCAAPVEKQVDSRNKLLEAIKASHRALCIRCAAEIEEKAIRQRQLEDEQWQKKRQKEIDHRAAKREAQREKINETFGARVFGDCSCGGVLIARLNSRTLQPFWGCTDNWDCAWKCGAPRMDNEMKTRVLEAYIDELTQLKEKYEAAQMEEGLSEGI